MSAYTTAARPASFGLLAFGLLITVYFAILTVISGWNSTLAQFTEFWFFLLPLAAGFGVQVALYVRLRQLLRQSRDAGTVMAASGTTSTAAMISCCTHYLANVAPVLGATGLVAFAAQFQLELFWMGIAFNLAGIGYIGTKLWKATKEHQLCLHA